VDVLDIVGTVKAFKNCSIINALDGTKDDTLWEILSLPALI